MASLQELKIAGQICQYISHVKYYPSNYRPSCPPLRTRDYVKSPNGKQGLLGRLKGRFGK